MPDSSLRVASLDVAIVDDDDAIRTALARLVRTIGYRSHSFTTGEDLLADFDKLRPGCVLTDIQMPGMNGLALLRQLRRRSPELPILVMTAYPSQTNREQAFAGGAEEYMTKPLDDVKLEVWLLRVLGKPTAP